jgi:hypothetical protein
MNTCAAHMGEWWGWLAGATGIIGSLAMVPPLFLLLRHREAIESIVHALDLDLLSEEIRLDAAEARRTLAASVFDRRHHWKPWVYSGVALQGVAAIIVALQFYCMVSA